MLRERYNSYSMAVVKHSLTRRLVQKHRQSFFVCWKVPKSSRLIIARYEWKEAYFAFRTLKLSDFGGYGAEAGMTNCFRIVINLQCTDLLSRKL